MRYALVFACAMPLLALAPVSGNAVQIEKKRFDELRNRRFPLWPDKAMVPKQKVTIPALKPGAVQVATPARPCAVPLTNMLRRSDPIPPMPRYRPRGEQFRSREAQVPAPSCEDAGRR